MGFQARSRSVAKIKQEAIMRTYLPENVKLSLAAYLRRINTPPKAVINISTEHISIKDSEVKHQLWVPGQLL